MPDSASERQPFDQRSLTFALLVTLILVMFNPWRQPPVEKPPAGDAGADPQAEALAEPPQVEPEADAGAAPEAAAPLEAIPAAAPERATLGSLAVDGPFRMLATLTNTGAAVERIELSSPDFRDLDNRSGYLGELGLEKADGGVRVTLIGPGTPAAEAGLQVGDVIQGAVYKNGSQSCEDPDTFADWLGDTKPKKEVSLSIKRGGEDLSFTLKLARRPLALLRPEAENIRLHSEALPADFASKPSYLVTLDRVGDLRDDSPEVVAANQALTEETWTVESATPTEIVFRKRLPGLRLEIVKRFRLPEVPEDDRDDRAFRGYHLDLEVDVVNLATAPQSVGYKVEGANGLPIEGWWYSYKVGPAMFSRFGIRDVVARYAGGGPTHFACSTIADAAETKAGTTPIGQSESMAYIGVDAQYFAAALLPEKNSLADIRFNLAKAGLATPKLPGDDVYVTSYNNPTYTVTTRPIDVPAGATWKDAYVLFAGPKRPELLAAYFPGDDPNYSLSGFLYYGWFGPVAKLMLVILHGFYYVFQNYGIAIICLTVLVRGCMHPLSRKQAMSMVKMQELKPEMDRIAQKHKDDRQKQAQAQQELFRKHGVNPLGGCLPMFIQLPIFIGLYRALAVDIELRQAPLISESVRWCSNLAAPDMLISWQGVFPSWFDNGQGIFALGPFFNVLPIATVALILIQQKMFMPQASTPEQELQQKLMKYMMAFMGLLFFKWASGLAVYFIASSVWGIAERKLLPKPTAAVGGAGSPASSSSAKKPPAKSKKSSPNSNGAAKSGGGKRKKSKKRK